MENEKIENQNPEVKDEELDIVSGGGARRPAQQQMKPCSTTGCKNQIPADTYPAYCASCLEKMRKQGVNPFV